MRDLTDEQLDEMIEHYDMKAYAIDMIDTYSCEEIAQMVREKVLTIGEVEAGLRRAHGRKAA